MHHLVLRVWFDLNALPHAGTPFPTDDIARSTDDMAREHEHFRGSVADVFRQRADRPTAHGLVPSWHATRLTIARATTYVSYVNAVFNPLVPFTGWTASSSGYMQVGDQLLLHWDNDGEGKPVLGPKADAEAALASDKRARQPLSAIPSPNSGGPSASKRTRKPSTRLNPDEYVLSGHA